jgi:hypothetical protein
MRYPLALAAVMVAVGAAPAAAHQGDPNMESTVRAVTPATAGVSVTVLNRDDRFMLRNESRETVLVEGYEGEPYARIGADGTVEVNTRSPAYYLNEERDGSVPVPKSADEDAPPEWKRVSKVGRFEWHDHRMHWMGRGRPPQVEDPDVRQKIFDYRVPIRIGDREGAISGTLTWTPLPGGDVPLPAILAGAGILMAGLLAVFLVRRRRV